MRRHFAALPFIILLALVLALGAHGIAFADDGGGASAPPDYLAALSIVTAFVTMFLTGLLTKASWPDGYKVLVCVIVSVVFAIAQLWVTGQTVWSLDNWYPIAASVFALATVIYQGIAWKVPGLKGWFARHGIKDPRVADATQ
jgi:hypothetical protein